AGVNPRRLTALMIPPGPRLQTRQPAESFSPGASAQFARRRYRSAKQHVRCGLRKRLNACDRGISLDALADACQPSGSMRAADERECLMTITITPNDR